MIEFFFLSLASLLRQTAKAFVSQMNCYFTFIILMHSLAFCVEKSFTSEGWNIEALTVQTLLWQLYDIGAGRGNSVIF